MKDRQVWEGFVEVTEVESNLETLIAFITGYYQLTCLSVLKDCKTLEASNHDFIFQMFQKRNFSKFLEKKVSLTTVLVTWKLEVNGYNFCKFEGSLFAWSSSKSLLLILYC